MINPDVAITELIGKYTQNRYLISLLIFCFFLFLSRLLAMMFNRVFMRIAEKTKTQLDDEIIKGSEKPLTNLIFVIGLKIALVPLTIIPSKIVEALNNILNSIIILILTAIIIKILDTIIDAWGKSWAERTKSTMDDEIIPLLHKFSRVVLAIIGLLIVLSLWGIAIGPFIASLGIAGIAIGFAVQDSLKNVFGGISLILDKNFRVDDTVKLSSGETGKVLDIGLRSTRILTWDHEVMIIPNGELANSTIVNYAQPDLMARVQIDFGVEYGSDANKVRDVILKAINSISNVLKEPEALIRFKNMADFSLDFTVYFWVSSYRERFETKDIATQAIYEALNNAGIGIPFPTRTLFLSKASKTKKRTFKKAKKAGASRRKAVKVKLTEEQDED